MGETDRSSPARGKGIAVGGGGGGLQPSEQASSPSVTASPRHLPLAGEDESFRDALRDAAARFGFSATPRLDAELLLAHALGVSREALLLDLSRPVPPGFAALVERRARHEPVAYLTGTRGFWTIDLAVGPGVLIPRADSETLIEAAVAHFAGTAGPGRVLDLGTGPGTLLLAALAEWPAVTGIGVDASAVALGFASENAAALGLEDRAGFRAGDWADGIEERFDLILCNPPYIATDEALPLEVSGYEPVTALFGGADGLDAYRALVPDLPRLLAAGGVACLEIGSRQGAAVVALAREQGLQASVRPDLGGRDRCVVATG